MTQGKHTLGCALKVKTKTSANLKNKDFTQICWGPRGYDGLRDMKIWAIRGFI